MSSASSSHQLHQAKREMQAELDRLRSTAVVLEDSSRTIQTIKGTYDKYSSSLSKASRTLKQLKHRIESDDRMIYYSFVFFLFSAGYVFLKRVRVLSLLRWFGVTTWETGEWVATTTGISRGDIPVVMNHTPPPPNVITTNPPRIEFSTDSPTDSDEL